LNKSELRIIFIGTPTFAVATFSKLLENNYNIVAAITSPDKPAGRGLQLQQSEVKQFALQHNIPVLQPSNLKDDNFIQELANYKADVQVVVAFRMLPEKVWNMPHFGTFNVHASLLPNYRGAAPINWAIINGEVFTGVSTFKLKHAIDTGNILLQEKVSIKSTDNAGTLHDTLMQVGGALMVKTLDQLLAGNLKEIDQDTSEAEETLKHASKLFKANCEINWNESAENINNLVRGLSPYPTAFTSIIDKKGVSKTLKIFSAVIHETINNGDVATGTWQSDFKNYLRFATTTNYIEILELQLEGKKRMTTQEFLRGNII
jgi:methionyl-tRNA formyltransferase